MEKELKKINNEELSAISEGLTVVNEDILEGLFNEKGDDEKDGNDR